MKQTIKKSNQIDYILYSIIGITLFSLILSILTLSSVHAETGTASDSKTSQASVTVSATCSMTANINTAHTATLPNGVWSGTDYPNGIGKTTIQTFCNDASGYSIYAVGYTGDTTDGGSTNSNTKLHSNMLGSGYDIATGTATSGNTSNWAMKVTKVTDSSSSYLPNNLTIQNGYDNSSYHTIPASYEEVARYTTATDATLGSKVETTYSAYIATAQPAGTYTGKVKYTLVHPGGSDAPDANTMQNVQYWGASLAVGEEVTVEDSRDGQSYTVARLCTNYDGDSCTSSQIWMTQNLNLQIGASGVTLNSINTDLNDAYEPDGTTLKKDYSISGSTITWTPTTTNTTASGVSTNNTLTGIPATISDFAYSSSATTVVSNWSNQSYYGYQAEGTLSGTEQYEWPGTSSGHIEHGSLKDCTSAGFTEAVCGHYKIGNYYNFTAANAMSNSTNYQTAYSVMDNSICPKGWRLPQGITSNGTVMSEFNQLLNAQGVTNGTDLAGSTNVGYVSGGFDRLLSKGIHGDPLYFARSGFVNGTTLYSSADGGYYWSSTVTPTATFGHHLRFGSGGIWPADQNLRLFGFSLRCVAR